MSALTKVFIVLHVVLTMLFVSAAIVTVNRVEDFRTTSKQKDDEVKIALRREQFATDEAGVARSERNAIEAQAGEALRGLRQELNTALSGNRERDTQLANLKQDALSAQASLQAATAAMSTAQDSNKLLTGQISETRTAADKTQQQNTELLTANSTLNSRLQIATRALRNTNERVEELQTEIADLQDRGGSPAGGREAVAGGGRQPGITPAVPIIGAIRDRRNVNGVPYATISIGSQDGVTENMVFNVIDRGEGGFLGYLRVDRVEPNEAVGRLEGPRVQDVKPDNEVRTQL